MDDNKLQAKEKQAMLQILLHLVKGQEIIAKKIYEIGEVDMDSRVGRRATDCFKQWEKNKEELSKYFLELEAILKYEK
ncbi:hypothetical protein GF336_05670 [Candidatus Woesearchaeota archaeon]|nr:hypothetical protein [Candidatus Woesearchaeota archaeon]